jgi:5-methyltetrahydropteroyltriglutamate--homocysteine methyltransferase
VTATGRPPARADHIGSLLRPAALRDAFKKRQAKQIDETGFNRILDDCIRDTVRMQEDIGLTVVNDGEFRRASYWGRFVERTEGFAIRPAAFKFHDDAGHEIDFTTPYAEKKLRRTRPLAVDEFEFLKQTARVRTKITLPAPSSMHFWAGRTFAAASAYTDLTAFFADLSRVFQEEIAALVQSGCSYVQLDEVALAMLCDPTIREKIAADGQNPDTLVDLYIDAINQAVAKVPATVAIGIHMCRGNFKGHYLSSGGYDSVAEKFFVRTNATHLLLEYDTERAGGFAPLRFVPKTKGVVLGLVSSKSPAIETLETLRRRVDEAGKHIEIDRLAISPQCGFASTVAGNPVTEDIQRAKLARIVEAARAIWG